MTSKSILIKSEVYDRIRKDFPDKSFSESITILLDERKEHKEHKELNDKEHKELNDKELKELNDKLDILINNKSIQTENKKNSESEIVKKNPEPVIEPKKIYTDEDIAKLEKEARERYKKAKEEFEREKEKKRKEKIDPDRITFEQLEILKKFKIVNPHDITFEQLEIFTELDEIDKWTELEKLKNVMPIQSEQVNKLEISKANEKLDNVNERYERSKWNKISQLTEDEYLSNLKSALSIKAITQEEYDYQIIKHNERIKKNLE